MRAAARASTALLAALAAAGILASCSTAPKESDRAVDVKNAAADSGRSGDAYYRQGRYDLAMSSYRVSLQDNLSVDSLEGIVQSYNSIARVQMATDRLTEARSTLEEALVIASKLGGEPLFVTNNNVGELKLRSGDAAGALETFQRLEAGATKEIAPERMALVYHNLGSAWKAAGNLDEAMSWLQKSLEINLARKLYEEAAGDFYMISSVHSRQGDLVAARENAEQALENDKRVENSLGIVKDLYVLGLIATKAGEMTSAADWYHRSWLSAAAISSLADARRALEGLVATADALDWAEEAAQYRAELAKLEGK